VARRRARTHGQFSRRWRHPWSSSGHPAQSACTGPGSCATCTCRWCTRDEGQPSSWSWPVGVLNKEQPGSQGEPPSEQGRVSNQAHCTRNALCLRRKARASLDATIVAQRTQAVVPPPTTAFDASLQQPGTTKRMTPASSIEVVDWAPTAPKTPSTPPPPARPTG